MSIVGTTAGLGAAAAMAVCAAAMLPGGVSLVLPVIVGATTGAFAESALSTRFEASGVVNNDLLNFIATGISAAVALAAWSIGPVS